MKFHVTSYRNGYRVLDSTPALREISKALASITLAEVDKMRRERQKKQKAKAGIQDGLNKIIHSRLTGNKWDSFVPVFRADEATKKGLWTMDFAKRYDESFAVGLEVTFNHAEALTWTPIRLTLAHEAEHVLPKARIDVGCIIIGTDDLKGKGNAKRMDSAVGTYERLVTVLPKMRAVLPAPLVIFGLDWSDGGHAGTVKELDLHSSHASGHASVPNTPA